MEISGDLTFNLQLNFFADICSAIEASHIVAFRNIGRNVILNGTIGSNIANRRLSSFVVAIVS